MSAPAETPVAAPIEAIESLARAGQFRRAEDAVTEALRAGGDSSYLLYCRGRNLRHLGDLRGAADALQAALALAPIYPPALLELAAVRLLRAEFPEAGRLALRFAETLDAQAAAALSAADRDVLLKSGHGSYAADRAGTVRLYERLTALGVRDYLTALRLAEAMADRGEMRAAEAALERLAAERGLDPWGKLIRVRVLRALGATKMARALAETVLAESKPDTGVRVQACHRLLDLGAVDQVRPYIETMAPLPEGQKTLPLRELRFRFACLAGGAPLAALVKTLAETPHEVSRFHDGLLIDAVFALSRPGADETARGMAAAGIVPILRARKHTPGTVLACLHHYQASGQWEQADALLADITDAAILDHPDIVLRRFELACRRRNFAEAAALYASRLAGRALNPWEAALVLRFLLEQGDDTAALRLIERRLEAGEELPRDEALVLQAIRRARAHARMLDLMDARPGDETESLAEIRRLVIDDMCLRDGAAWVRVSGKTRRISAQNRWLTRGRAEAVAQAAAGCAFLCTDRAYFLSAITFLLSVAARSPVSAARLDWFVFLDAAVPEAWHAALARAAEVTGLVLRVVAADEFLPAAAATHDAYGIFTGGMTLSRAAYYRLYAARYLAASGAYPFGCYFDTDIICRGELAPMLAAEFGPYLLLARTEDGGEDAALAASRCGMAPGDYFNSGVLKMNFRGEGFDAALARAIGLAEHEPTRLTFHDQCALNIGFAGQVGALAANLNHFLRPHRADTAEGSEKAIMLHYVDRPKPWDTAFKPLTRRFFEPHAREARAMLDADLFAQLVAAANGLAPDGEDA